MSKRKWTNVQLFGAEINAMREAGKTRQEIADLLGLNKTQIKNWINRYNKKQAAKTELHSKGRPRKDGNPSQQNLQKELERLRMENKLLRDFLQLVGRM